MSAPNFITLTGNLTGDPEPRLTSSEIPFTRLRVAVNRRTFNAEASAWEARQDGFYTVTCWRDTARHVAMSLRKGDRIVVTGRLTHREYETTGPDGTAVKREAVEVEADEIGPSLRWTAWARLEARQQPEPVVQQAADEDVAAAA